MSSGNFISLAGQSNDGIPASARYGVMDVEFALQSLEEIVQMVELHVATHANFAERFV